MQISWGKMKIIWITKESIISVSFTIIYIFVLNIKLLSLFILFLLQTKIMRYLILIQRFVVVKRMECFPVVALFGRK